ncbi:antibiotic biosynthesis monooxygenase [Sphingobacterium sp. SRCM116780]|uniref:putative quinol monooxygenase n=1 Tax=Sphingobacterium sp. SRCM116780 TaxID=2907623 RepID=UPI001F476C05|nr:antibiotic biosynthesis monooxygenase [Sphingobacterium sp. SRCM116780]UIR57707.1 antibiotic biosynthesis monooxygenase [Sphingobacterium sp. SRCM116780]
MKINMNMQRNLYKIGFVLITLLTGLFANNKAIAQKKDMLIRISEIEIYPEHLTAYKVILQEEAEASMKLEAGVVAIFPMYQKEDSTQIRIVEIYNGNKAYQSHLKTPHFLKYKTMTLKMVKALKLIDMDAIDPASMKLIFRKLKN